MTAWTGNNDIHSERFILRFMLWSLNSLSLFRIEHSNSKDNVTDITYCYVNNKCIANVSEKWSFPLLHIKRAKKKSTELHLADMCVCARRTWLCFLLGSQCVVFHYFHHGLLDQSFYFPFNVKKEENGQTANEVLLDKYHASQVGIAQMFILTWLEHIVNSVYCKFPIKLHNKVSAYKRKSLYYQRVRFKRIGLIFSSILWLINGTQITTSSSYCSCLNILSCSSISLHTPLYIADI